MRTAAKAISWLALAGTLLPPLLFFADSISLESVKLLMLGATVAWFVATPLWMERSAGD